MSHVSQKTDWRGVAARMRGELDRADLNGRARRLAEFAIKATLMAGRYRVVIPNRMEVCDLLKIGKTHVAEVVAALVSAKIVSFKETADGWELLVFPDSSQWMVEWLYERLAMARCLAGINQAPGQCQGELIEPPPNLSAALAATSLEAAARPGGHESRVREGGRAVAEDSPGAPGREPGRMAGGYQNGNSVVTEKGTGVAPFKALKVQGSKTSKAFSFESLKGAVLAIEGKDEGLAMDGCRQILGEQVMLNDGGKWRMRWRSNRAKVHRVFAAAVEDMAAREVRSTGAHTEWLWKQFAG